MLLIFSICCKDTYFTNRVNYNGIEYFYRVYAIGCTGLSGKKKQADTSINVRLNLKLCLYS